MSDHLLKIEFVGRLIKLCEEHGLLAYVMGKDKIDFHDAAIILCEYFEITPEYDDIKIVRLRNRLEAKTNLCRKYEEIIRQLDPKNRPSFFPQE